MAYKGNSFFCIVLLNKTHVVREYCGIGIGSVVIIYIILYYENLFAKANKFRI